VAPRDADQTDAASPDISALLHRREVEGLRWFIGVQIVAIAILGVGLAIFVSNPGGQFISGMTAALACLVLFWLFRLTGRTENLLLVGLATGLVAIVVTGPIPFLEWRSAGIDQVPGAYLAKTGYVMGPAIVGLSALTLNPRHPLTLTALILLLEGIYLAVALSDGRTVYAEHRTWEEHVMGPAIHFGKVANQLAFFAATGAIISLVAWVARRTVRSGVALEKSNVQLQRYFSPDVARTIAGAEVLRPGGRVREIAVLSSDIQGFTRLSHDLTADQTVALLARYREAMTAAIFGAGGSIDKFIGDGILATFGALTDLPDARDRALRAAVDMNRALAAMNAELRSEGRAPLAHRIGLDAGEALVGNVGTPERLEFTVIGDVVNRASRIEQQCKRSGDSLLLSEAVRAGLAGPAELVSRGRPDLPGIEEPPELFGLPDGAEPMPNDISAPSTSGS